MKIAVIAAGGRIGSLTTDEAVERGHDVTAFVRSDRSTRAQHTVVKDAREISADDLAGFDAVVDAFGAWVPEELDQHDEVTKALADAVAGTSTKLYVVGSAGTMLMDRDPAKPLRDSEIMLEEYKPLAKAMGKAFDNLRERDDVNWVYVTPPLDFRADGPRTGEYAVDGDAYTTNKDGVSTMSYTDYVVGMLDIIEGDKFTKRRVSLRSN